MSQNSPETPSSSKYQLVFSNALATYQQKTGKDLESDPLLTRLKSCNSPDTVFVILREHIPGFDQSGGNDDRLSKWLTPIVNVLYEFSSFIGSAVSLAYPPASVIFTGIAFLLSAVQRVKADKVALFDLFDRIESFFRRLEVYVNLPLMEGMTAVIVKVMVEVLLIIALATREIQQGKIKRFFKKLQGRSGIEDALQRLDKLTWEEHQMAAAQDLCATQHVAERVTSIENDLQLIDEGVTGLDKRINVVIEGTGHIREELQQVAIDVTDQKRAEIQRILSGWLSPSDPFINYNIASSARHKDTGLWFIQGSTFNNWKRSTSLLWIHGKPGAGKSVLTSAIIEDVNYICNTGSAHIAFFFFDYKDSQKIDARDLLSSLVVQLSNQSNAFYDILLRFHSSHHRGSRQPSIETLTQCLEDILKASEDVPIYLIFDAVDECPNMTGMPSSRDQVLSLIERLVDLDLPNLHLCATSRPEIDIRTSLGSLTSTSNCISLHDQSGQRKDIADFVRAVVYSDRNMRRWRDEDKELTVETLSERADGMFRWVYCQLETLRHCLPPSVQGVLMGLPESLDATYERILQQIPKPNRLHSHRLLQCLVVALRPLCVEELAEVLAIDFSSTNGIPKVNDKLRWEDQEQAVLSACSSLVTVVEDRGSRLIQFSHFSVKEFLTSDRLTSSMMDGLRYHHIRLEAAHTIMAQACLGVLLNLDDNMGATAIRNHPLAKYAGFYFGVHAEFGDVLSHITDGVDDLVDPAKPHFNMWVWLQIGDWDPTLWHNSRTTVHLCSMSLYRLPHYPPRVSPLYYVAALGYLTLAKRLISKSPQDLNSKDEMGCTPLHISVLARKSEVSQLILRHTVDFDIRDVEDFNLLHMVAWKGQWEVAQMLLEHEGAMKALVRMRNKDGQTPLHLAVQHADPMIAELLINFGADVDARDNNDLTPLHSASEPFNSDDAVVQLLLVHDADVHVRNKAGQTPLHLASRYDRPSIVALLFKSGADVDAHDNDNMTPLHCALWLFGSDTAAQLLLEYGANRHVRNKEGKTPLHLASQKNSSDIVALLLKMGVDVDAQDNDNMTPLLCALQWGRGAIALLLLEHGASRHVRNKEGRTPLHLASEKNFSDVVALLLKMGVDVDARDNNDMTPLLSALESFLGNGAAVQPLLVHGADVHVRNKNGLTPLHSAACRGFLSIVELLLKSHADVDAQDNDNMTPLHCSLQWRGRDAITQLLLEHGASRHVRNKEGQTPLHFASVNHCSPHIVALLQQDLGASVDG